MAVSASEANAMEAVIDARGAKPPGRPIGFLIIEMLSLPEYNALASVPLTLSSKHNSTSTS